MKKLTIAFAALTLLSLAACGKTEDILPVPVAAVKLNKSVLTMPEGASETIYATVTPGNAANLTVTWDSTDKKVATVNRNGMVTAVAPGQATITATANDGSGKSDECAVTVNAIPITGIKLNKEVLPLVAGAGQTLIPTFTPGNATYKTVSWDSSDKTVATVDENGKVTGIAKGRTTITATTTDGNKSAECVVSVIENVLGTASFKTAVTWTVAGKTWSDAVIATRCQKEDFDGGSINGGFKIDCRKSEATDYWGIYRTYGDLFSWEAVNTHQSILCPEPWRTPTAQDLADLDIAFGGKGSGDTEMLSGRIQLYINQWGGEYGGFCTGNYQEVTQYAAYWSGESLSLYYAAALRFGGAKGFLTPVASVDKSAGQTLRCIK